MDENTNTLLEKLEELYKLNNFEEIIALITEEELKREKEKDKYKAAELYIWRGNAWYNKKDYDKAIEDYNKALNINSKYELAFYNRGSAHVAKKEYDKAIEDYSRIIKFHSKYADTYFTDRGNVWKAIGKFKEAIDDYTEALKINPFFANAFYYRGLTKNEKNIDLEGSKQDFENYLSLTNEKDIGAKYAKYYIKELKEKIEDPDLWSIRQSINYIKNILSISENYITHYTSLSVLKNLILNNSKFRISEGNFMNDPSEGKEFFNFLNDNKPTLSKKESYAESFSPKPFIGSFVAKDKYDDLNMWRFYGKEAGIEAKGCAITLRRQEFINNIKSSISNEDNKDARLNDESDITFYQVVYVIHNNGCPKFNIPNINNSNKSEEFEKLMKELKVKVNSYNGNNQISLEEYLNSIAFLFKSDAYINENEVRLVIKGKEFEKEYNMDISSPNVYIELVSIKDVVSQITLGPKVDKANEWKSALHYGFKENGPTIFISRLPYK